MNQPSEREKPKSRQSVDNKIPDLIRSPAEFKAMGKALQDKCSRISHAEWRCWSRSTQFGLPLRSRSLRLIGLKSRLR